MGFFHSSHPQEYITTEKFQAKPVVAAKESGSFATTNTTEKSKAEHVVSEKESGTSVATKTTEKLKTKSMFSGKESGSSTSTNTTNTTTVGTNEDPNNNLSVLDSPNKHN